MTFLRQSFRLLSVSCALGMTTPCSFAGETKGGDKSTEAKEEKKDETKKDDAKEVSKTTQGEITLGGEKISYEATAGTLSLTKPDGEATARVFYISYVKKGVSDVTKRPVMFCFNGGPGSSSVWLHMGAYGPRRVVLPGDGVNAPRPPFDLVANEHSLLDAADLVFIDPVSTGYSRAEKGQDAKQFHGYQQDLDSVGDFIRRWTTRNKRWASPKFVSGESYGGLRSAGLAGHLQDRYGMYLNGVVIVSGVVDFSALSASGSNDLPYITFLPTMTAAAHYHKKLPADFQVDLATAVKEAETFAMGPYATALLKGNDVPQEEQEKLAAQLARLTSIPADLWLRNRLRLSSGVFFGKLLESERKRIGRFDARAVIESTTNDDPSYTNIYGAYSTMFNNYVRTELNYESDLPYEILTGEVQPWNYQPFTNRYVTAADALNEALLSNPHLKVFVACGWYDMATPPLNIKHTISHLAIDPARIAADVSLRYYEGGHMMYVNPPALATLASDIRSFVKASQ